MNTWLEVAVSLVSIGITVTISFYFGRYVGECQANFKFSGMYTGMLKDLGKESAENWEKKRLIELMKRTGRRRREEIKRLKKKLNGNAITMKMDSDGNLWWN